MQNRSGRLSRKKHSRRTSRAACGRFGNQNLTKKKKQEMQAAVKNNVLNWMFYVF